MPKFTEEDFKFFSDELSSADPLIRGGATVHLASSRSQADDSRLIPYLKKLLNDHCYTILSIPYSYGEIRYAAAFALGRLYKNLAIHKTVELKRVPVPVDEYNDYRIHGNIPDSYKARITKEGLQERILQEYEIRRDLGQFPFLDITIAPGDAIQFYFKREYGLPKGFKWSKE